MRRAVSSFFSDRSNAKLWGELSRLHEGDRHLDKKGRITEAYFNLVLELVSQNPRDILTYYQDNLPKQQTIMDSLTAIIATLSSPGFVERNEDSDFYAQKEMTSLKFLRQCYTRVVLLRGNLIGRSAERVALINNYTCGEIVAYVPMPALAVELALEYYFPFELSSAVSQEPPVLIASLPELKDEDDVLDVFCQHALSPLNNPKLFRCYEVFFERFFDKLNETVITFLKRKNQSQKSIIIFIDLLLHRVVLRFEKSGLMDARGQIQTYYTNFINRLVKTVEEECEDDTYYLFLRQYYNATKQYCWYQHLNEALDAKQDDPVLAARNTMLFKLIISGPMLMKKDLLQQDWKLRRCLAGFLGLDGFEADFDLYIIGISQMLKKLSGDVFVIHMLSLLRKYDIFSLAIRRMNDLWDHYKLDDHAKIRYLDLKQFKLTDLFNGNYKTLTLNAAFVASVRVAYHGEPSLAVFYEFVSIAHALNKRSIKKPSLPIESLQVELCNIEIVIEGLIDVHSAELKEQLVAYFSDVLYEKCSEKNSNFNEDDADNFAFKLGELFENVKAGHYNDARKQIIEFKKLVDSMIKKHCDSPQSGSAAALVRPHANGRNGMDRVFTELRTRVPEVEGNHSAQQPLIGFLEKAQVNDGTSANTRFDESLSEQDSGLPSSRKSRFQPLSN